MDTAGNEDTRNGTLQLLMEILIIKAIIILSLGLLSSFTSAGQVSNLGIPQL